MSSVRKCFWDQIENQSIDQSYHYKDFEAMKSNDKFIRNYIKVLIKD